METSEVMEVLGRAPGGCHLVTVAAAGKVNGMPLSLFMPASFKPPLVALGVAPSRRTHSMLVEARAFAVIFLRRNQKALVDRFKKKGDPDHKFEGLDWSPGRTGAPLLADCLGYLECKLTNRLEPGGDHTLFIGEVVAARLVNPGPILTLEDLGKVYTGPG